MARNILVVEDDRNISDLIRMYMEKEGFEVRSAYDGGKAIEEFEKQAPDLVLLDIMLPVMDGWAVCRKIRETSKVPIIMLTAKGEVNDRITGLEMGADDYIVKPFEMMELLVRMEKVLERRGKAQTRFLLGGVAIEAERRTVTRDGIDLNLTPMEFDLLLLLVRKKNVAMSREGLLNEVWGIRYEGGTRTVDVHIAQLRKKTGLPIVSVPKIGYRLEVD